MQNFAKLLQIFYTLEFCQKIQKFAKLLQIIYTLEFSQKGLGSLGASIVRNMCFIAI